VADFGTVPDWISSVGTVGAFGATIWLLFRETDARRRDVDEHERRQAQDVSCWLGDVPDEALGFDDEGRPYRWIDLVYVRNGSAEPIYAVGVFIDQVDDQPPWHYVGVIAPGETSRRPWTPPDSLHEPVPALRFTDAAGRDWIRDGSGRLRREPRVADVSRDAVSD
jgi:hypothetical protein